MKKSILFIFTVCTSLVSGKVYAIYPDLTVLSTNAPQLCSGCTAEQIKTMKSAVEYVKTATDGNARKKVFGEAEAHLKKYAIAQSDKLLQKYKDKLKTNEDAEEKPISYTRIIKQTKTDLNNVIAVKEAFKKYFLYVPSKNEEIQASYREKREQFVEDTTLELYITAKEMDAELKVMLSQLDIIQQCVILGDNEKCKAEGLEEYNCQKDDGTEDEMCYRRNILMIADIYDTILKNNEYLMAMRAQYEAVRALGQGVKPKEYSEEKKKKSALSGYSETSMAYAAQEIENESLVIENLPDSEFEFSDNDNIGMETPLTGKEDELKAPAIFYEAQKYVSDAIESHNLKQQLPTLKEVFESYHNMEKLHYKALDELANSQSCVLNYLSKRYSDSESVWFDSCRIYQFGDKAERTKYDGYICAYNPPKQLSDTTESEGLYDVLCPDNPAHKCYKLSTSAYNEIGGMSGWAINTYLDTKDALSDMVEYSENYVVEASDSEIPADKPVAVGTGVYAVEDIKNQVSNNKIITDEYKENIRKLSKTSMQVGVVINEEIDADTNGINGPSKYNTATKPFNLWNDQINFYNQYIDGKYENLHNYFKQKSLFVEILNLGLKINETYEYEAIRNSGGAIVKTVEAIRQEVAEQINKLIEVISAEPDDKAEKAAEILTAEKQALDKATEAFKTNLKNLEKTRYALYEKLENINIKAAELNELAEQQNTVINYAEDYIAPAEVAAEMDKDYQTTGNPHKTMEETLSENVQEQEQKEQVAEKARAEARTQLQSLTSQKNQIIEDIKNIELKIKALRSDYVLAYYNAEQKYKADLDELLTEDEPNKIQETFVKAISDLTVVGKADELFNYLREYAQIKVDEAKKQIDALKTSGKESLYYSQNNPKVVKIHSDMTDKLINPDISDIKSALNLDDAKALEIEKYAENLLAPFSDICKDVNCNKPDSQYFVGLVAQEKDFAAPKAAVDFSAAPMREVFSFDLSDLDYIDNYSAKKFYWGADQTIIGEKTDITDKDSKVLLIKNSLTDSGLDLPEIWKIVLSHRPFVQKDLDLNEFLHHDIQEDVALARSGIYPCQSAGSIIDVIPNGDGSVQYGKIENIPANYTSLPQCRTILQKGSKFIDVQANSKMNEIKLNPSQSVSTAQASELGTILQYDEIVGDMINEYGIPETDGIGINLQHKIQYLTFRKEFLTALKFLYEYNSNYDSENGFNAEYYMYNRILPQNSQISDYLKKVDIERTAAEAHNKLKNAIYSPNINDLVIVNSLYNSFAAMGYDFDREKFDLSQTAYYTQAENVLKERKESCIKEAKAILKGEKLQSLSEDMQKRKDDLLRKIALLELDAEEIVSLDSSETLEELAEKIKNAKTDRAILQKDIEAGKADFEERLNTEEPAYCAVYE